MTILYHWSPSVNRPGIQRLGLVPGRAPVTYTDSDPGFRADHTCFAEDPLWAWALSGDVIGKPGQSWDLWCANVDLKLHRFKRMRHHPDEVAHPCRWHEWRIYDRVYKRNVVYVASRTIPRKKK